MAMAKERLMHSKSLYLNLKSKYFLRRLYIGKYKIISWTLVWFLLFVMDSWQLYGQCTMTGSYQGHVSFISPPNNTEIMVGDTVAFKWESTGLEGFNAFLGIYGWTDKHIIESNDCQMYGYGEKIGYFTKDGKFNNMITFIPTNSLTVGSMTDSFLYVIEEEFYNQLKGRDYLYIAITVLNANTSLAIFNHVPVKARLDNESPEMGSIIDGLSMHDIDFTNSTSSLSAHWTGFTDKSSFIKEYLYAIGTYPKGVDISMGWESAGSDTFITVSKHTLSHETTYYFSVKAKDAVGNYSEIATSDGITGDLVGPTISNVIDGTTIDLDWVTSDTMNFKWAKGVDSGSGLKHYRYALWSAAGTPIDWTDTGSDTTLQLVYELKDGEYYMFGIAGVDSVGNIGDSKITDGFTADFSAPSIANVTPADGGVIPVLRSSDIIINPSEPISHISAKVEGSLSGDIDYILTISDPTNIYLNIQLPLVSGEKISVTIDSLTDLAGNISNIFDYDYQVAFIADYNQDESIDASDLSTLINGWTNKDYSYELGPAIGEVPNLTPSLDGKYDIMDAAVLIRMWHWNLNKAGKMQARYVNTGKELNYINENNSLSIQVPKDVNAVDFYFDYPQEKLSIEQFQGGSSNKEIILSNIDTLNGEFLITAGYLEPRLQSIEVPYTIKGRENVTITAIYRMFNNNGEIMSQGTREIDLKPVPKEFALHQNYPNPFNPITTINYDLPQQAHVNLMIYDILGREVVKLVSSEIPAGYQSVIWNTRNSFGTPVSAGIYFYQIQTKDFVKTKKMVLLK